MLPTLHKYLAGQQPVTRDGYHGAMIEADSIISYTKNKGIALHWPTQIGAGGRFFQSITLHLIVFY